MGGNGAWYLAYRYASKFAALAPLCGWVIPFSSWARYKDAVVPGDTAVAYDQLARKLGRLPTWIVHGEEDPVVPVQQSRRAAAALQKSGADVHYTEMPGIGHNCWDAAYNSSSFITWLFSQRRSK